MNTIIEYIKAHWTSTIVPAILLIFNYINTTLSLAIAQADKNNDGTLSEREIEDLCLFLVRNSKTVFIKLIPEIFIRKIVKALCYRRKSTFNVEVPKLADTNQIENKVELPKVVIVQGENPILVAETEPPKVEEN